MQAGDVISYRINFFVAHTRYTGAHDFDVAVIVATFIGVLCARTEIAQLLGDIVCVRTAHLWKACRCIAHAGG